MHAIFTALLRERKKITNFFFVSKIHLITYNFFFLIYEKKNDDVEIHIYLTFPVIWELSCVYTPLVLLYWSSIIIYRCINHISMYISRLQSNFLKDVLDVLINLLGNSARLLVHKAVTAKKNFMFHKWIYTRNDYI